MFVFYNFLSVWVFGELFSFFEGGGEGVVLREDYCVSNLPPKSGRILLS